ncbi:MAG: hypothetical protein PHV37_09015 [Candidatus Gastranaerophilales bacterium]|nr:hypothetical protein [Candidatus Gastranaerophilales bacterium]
MVTVPQYQREVKAQPVDTPYEQVQTDINMFGGNIAQAGNKLAAAVQNTGDAVLEIKNMIDQTKMVEISNLESQWEQDKLYDKEKGYFYKKGKDAYGQSANILADFDKEMNDKIATAGLNPANANRFRADMQRMRERVQAQVNRHDFQEGINYSNAEAKNGLTNAVTSAVNSRNTPADVDKQITTGYQLIDWQAEIQHKDAATVALEKKEFLSNVHEEVLSAYLAEGSLKATDYLNKHKAEINPERLPNFINAVKDNQLSYTARTTASALVGLPMADAYKKINDIKDPQTRNAVEGEYTRLKRQNTAVKDENDRIVGDQIMQEVFTRLDNGQQIGDVMAAVNRSDLSFDAKIKIYNNLKTAQELNGAGDNWADYNYLLDMAATNHEEFLKENPALYMLNKEQYQKIKEMQRTGADVQYTPEAGLKKAIKKFFIPFGTQAPGGLHSSDIQDGLVKTLSEIERRQGSAFNVKNITDKQIGDFINAMNYKDANAKNKNIDESKELLGRAGIRSKELAKLYNDKKKEYQAYSMLAKEYTIFKQQEKREPKQEEIHSMCKKIYNSIENEYKQKAWERINNTTNITYEINATIPKKGETKVLTYTADVALPELGRRLGMKFTYVDGARYRAGNPGGHGKGYKLDVSMSEHKIPEKRTMATTEILKLPQVAKIGTSDPILLKKFGGTPKLNYADRNPKIVDLREYDRKHGTNHENHLDIVLDTRFGGTTQGNGSHPAINRPTYMTAKK